MRAQRGQALLRAQRRRLARGLGRGLGQSVEHAHARRLDHHDAARRPARRRPARAAAAGATSAQKLGQTVAAHAAGAPLAQGPDPRGLPQHRAVPRRDRRHRRALAHAVRQGAARARRARGGGGGGAGARAQRQAGAGGAARLRGDARDGAGAKVDCEALDMFASAALQRRAFEASEGIAPHLARAMPIAPPPLSPGERRRTQHPHHAARAAAALCARHPAAPPARAARPQRRGRRGWWCSTTPAARCWPGSAPRAR